MCGVGWRKAGVAGGLRMIKAIIVTYTYILAHGYTHEVFTYVVLLSIKITIGVSEVKRYWGKSLIDPKSSGGIIT